MIKINIHVLTPNRLLELMIKYGGNPRCLSSATSEPSSKISKILMEVHHNHTLSIFPAVYSEGLGLSKYAVLVKNFPIKYETAARLLHPIMNLFRGDIEENMFSIILFGNKEVVEDLHQVIDRLKQNGTSVLISEIRRTREFVRDPQCYDFTTGKWTCYTKIELRQGSSLSRPDNEDVHEILTLQLNPFFDIRLLRHKNHVFKIITGFMYVLGEKNFIVQAFTKDDISDRFPDIVWTAETNDGFISEMHLNKEGLEFVMRKLRNEAIDVIISPKSPLYALGYSIPYEIFTYGKWSFPKIKIVS